MIKKNHSVNDKKILKRYANLMDEIKHRNRAIIDARRGFSPPQSAVILRDFCYLQLRFICESIALGCLIVHGDLRTINKDLNKLWHGGKLIKRLGDLHPDFYPRPTKQINSTVGKLELVKDGFLSQEDFSKVYGKIGDNLHMGNIDKIVSGDHYEIDFSEIDEIAKSIRNLLNCHIIQMVDSDFLIYTVMQEISNGNVCVMRGKWNSE